ncbi:MAG TPA: zinc ribbon domain-containing protein [Gemmatimonadaceae bacterium]|nr:zinc ribbon domain-containing protein [Gemmatimonadaceae bacterium]
MPIFEYSCKNCGREFETLVRKNSVPTCPSCKGTDLEKKFSLPAVQSETTHGLAMRAAKKRDARQGAEREYTQREYEKHHDD